MFSFPDSDDEDEDAEVDVAGGGDSEELLDGMAPTSKRKEIARRDALNKCLGTGEYPEFTGLTGVVDELDPLSTECLDFVKLLWPDSLCEHIAVQTNLYARQSNASGWVDTCRDEIWTFIGIVLEMGIHRLPSIEDYWSRNLLLGVQPVQRVMSKNRFLSLWHYLHCDDNTEITDFSDVTCKIRTVLSTLSSNFLARYNPSQELSVDEMMVKYKGRKGGKIKMPRKPVKVGFKVWSCSCSCCSYLCSFQVYNGRLTDSSGNKVSEKGLVSRVVNDLVEPFHGECHVVYMDNFYTSGPLIHELAKHKTYVVGTIKQSAAGFPSELKGVKLAKGEYIAKTVDGVRYFAFSDRQLVCFATNVFPESMPDPVFRVQADGTLCAQLVPPLLPAYNQYMGGVDNTGRLQKTYGYDRKCRRYWFRLLFYFVDVAVNNAYILYKHNCRRMKVKSQVLKWFRLKVIGSLLCTSQVYRCSRSSSVAMVSLGAPLSPRACVRVNVKEVMLPRGRCHYCVSEKKPSKEQKHTTMACPICVRRICRPHSLHHRCIEK